MSFFSSRENIHEISIPGYEKVVEFVDKKAGLHALIAIHNTSLGPALGGTRIYPYSSVKDALTDVLYLAKGMTYKAAIAGTGTGGGKSVIIGDSYAPKNREMLLAFANAVNTFSGSYICAEDIGVTPNDLATVREATRYVVGIPNAKSSGDPSPYTAHGVIQGIKALCQSRWKSAELRGKTIAIQGFGAVGQKVAKRLYWEGVNLIVTDVDPKKREEAKHLLGAKIIAPDEIFSVSCDIFCPCALGGVLNSETIPLLNCEIVGGSANNQLSSDEDATLLHQRGILYAPDYVINAGGLINVCKEIDATGYSPLRAREGVDRIFFELLEIFEKSESNNLPTGLIANQIGDEKLTNGIGKRIEVPVFHH